MITRALFLDRDGTIIRDRGFISDISKVEIYPRVADSLRAAQKKFMLFIVTNQTGVGKGVITHEDARRVNGHVVAMLQAEGVAVSGLYCCPHVESDRCDCRKPSPRFLLDAASRHRLDLSASYVVGDHPSDMALARNAGAIGLYVLTGHGRKHRHEPGVGERVFRDLNYACNYAMKH